MKKTRTLLLALTLGALSLGTFNTSAFPLYLKSLSGTISCTPSFSAIDNTNVAKITSASVTLKRALTVVSNQVFLDSGTNPPADVKIVFDPYFGTTYLTNATGYYYNLNDIVSFQISQIATAFKGNSGGGSENDRILVGMSIRGIGPDGLTYEFDLRGQGSLKFSVKSTGPAKMSISLSNGSDYGEFQDSDSGVAKGNFSLQGSGTPEWDGPFSTAWW